MLWRSSTCWPKRKWRCRRSWERIIRDWQAFRNESNSRCARGETCLERAKFACCILLGQSQMTISQRSWRRSCRLLLLILFVALPVCAQQIDPSIYSALHWRLIGPFRGGRALAVTGVPGKPETFYFGAVGGGIWKTSDGGGVWQPTFDQQHIASIGALAVAPSNADIIYAGSGEADMRSDISLGDGMYKSSDGGQSWQNIGLRDTRPIGRIIVDPHDPNILLVAALGHAYGPNRERGVFRSSDGGASWQKVLYKNEDTGAIDLCFNPGNAKEIYAAMWQTRRPPWSVYPPQGGPGSGLY